MYLRTRNRLSAAAKQILSTKVFGGIFFVRLFCFVLFCLIWCSEFLAQTPNVVPTYFCNLSTSSLTPFIPPRDVIQREFSTVSIEPSCSGSDCHWTSHVNSFLSLSRRFKADPQPFSVLGFFSQEPFPALDLDSFFSHPFQLFIVLSPKVLFVLERKFLEISAKLLHCFSPPTYGPSPSHSHPLTPPPGGYKYHKQLSFCCVKITTCISDWYWVLCFMLLVP